MQTDGIDLSALLDARREPLLARWRTRVRELPSARDLPSPILDDQVGDLFDELVHQLELSTTAGATPAHPTNGAAAGHGVERLRAGFDVDEVVAEYHLLRQLVFEEMVDTGATLSLATVQVVDSVVDRATGVAVKTYARQRSLNEQRSRAEYIAFVSHEIRNSLAIVRNGAELARHQATTIDWHGLLDRGVQRIEQLVRRLIDDSHQIGSALSNGLSPVSLDLRAITAAIVNDYQAAAATLGIQLVTTIPAGMMAYADPNFLDVIVGNLVKNAVDHSHARHVELGAAVASDGMVRCWVEDDGRGLDPELRSSTFEPYVSSRRDGNSGGLGLYIAKCFVEAHGGSIEVSDAPGGGTRFEFTLPSPSRN